MTPNISVIRVSDDRLMRDVWNFIFMDNDMSLVLTRYSSEYRKTTRHGWTIQKMWDTYDNRSHKAILASEVPLSIDVRLEAIESFTSQLKCKTWSEYKGEK